MGNYTNINYPILALKVETAQGLYYCNTYNILKMKLP